jgi:hypothetical protein
MVNGKCVPRLYRSSGSQLAGAGEPASRMTAAWCKPQSVPRNVLDEGSVLPDLRQQAANRQLSGSCPNAFSERRHGSRSGINRAGSSIGVVHADALMVAIGLDAAERGELISVTPQLTAVADRMIAPPADRGGLALNHPSLQHGSRWHDGRFKIDRPY